MSRRPPELGAYADASSEAARARERMTEAAHRHGRAPSARTRQLIGWTIVLIIAGLFVAVLAGWIGILPG